MNIKKITGEKQKRINQFEQQQQQQLNVNLQSIEPRSRCPSKQPINVAAVIAKKHLRDTQRKRNNLKKKEEVEAKKKRKLEEDKESRIGKTTHSHKEKT